MPNSATPSPADATVGGKARLDINKLDEIVDFYFQRAIANSTQRSYASAQSRYLSFCNQFGIPPLPVQEAHLCRFASFLANDNISHATIKCYLSAVRRLQIANNLPDPLIASMPKLESIVRGIKSQQAVNKDPTDKRLPITVEILNKLWGYFSN